MFNKLSLFALAAPLVNALTLSIPTNPTSGGDVTINWTFENSDPSTFSIELTNEAFHNSFAIATSLGVTQGTITLTLPIVPVGDGYTLQAVNVGNINDVYSQTGDFAIGANGATSVSSISQSSTKASSSATASGTASGSVKASSSVTPTTLSVSATAATSSTSAFGVTVTSPTVSSATSAASTSAQVAPAASTFSSGASANYKFGVNMGTMAAGLLSAIAGAAIVLL